MREIEFRAYLEDSLLSARIDLPDGIRLTDFLNESEEISLIGAELKALDDGRVVTAGDVTIPVIDILLVEAFDDYGGRDRRIRTRSSQVEMVIGPYRVDGYVHGPTAGDPVESLSRRSAMLPVTSAKVAFWLAGELEVRERAVAIVNRLLADVGIPEPHGPSVLEKFGLLPVDPRAKDLTRELLLNPPGEKDPESAP